MDKLQSSAMNIHFVANINCITFMVLLILILWTFNFFSLKINILIQTFNDKYYARLDNLLSTKLNN